MEMLISHEHNQLHIQNDNECYKPVLVTGIHIKNTRLGHTLNNIWNIILLSCHLIKEKRTIV